MNKLTNEEFIKRASIVHNNKYDYSKVNYVNCATKVCIICPEHGEFWQSPNNHLKGRKCPMCSGKEVKDTASFIIKARKVWGDRFDYSKTVYTKSNGFVCVIDKDGKEYQQRANNHLSGYDPAVNNLISKEDFIAKANKLYNNKYDYHLVNFQKGLDRVEIICPEHGIFKQTIYRHLDGRGCPKCSSVDLHNQQRMSLQEFIEKSNIKHQNKYDYSKVEYKNNRTKVCIICPEHGEFWQEPTSHLKGCGCPICGGRSKLDSSTFIQKANLVHNNKYDYSKVEYKNNNTKVCIVCPKHGEFWQLPLNHLRNQGCPICGKGNIKETELYDSIVKLFPNEKIIHSFWENHMEYDIYFPKYHIAIEYQGIQHFQPIDFGNLGTNRANIDFMKNQERDKKKLLLSRQKGVNLLYFTDLNYEEFNGEPLYHSLDTLQQKIQELIEEENKK